MREFRKWIWTAVVAAVAATPAVAQQGTITTGGGRTTGSLTGTGGLAGGGTGAVGGTGSGNTGGGTGGGFGGGTGGGTGGTGAGGELGGTALMTIQAAPQLTAPTGAATSALQPTNRFAGYYANPYFQGNSLQTNALPGGFGIPPNVTGTTGRGAISGTTGIGTGLGTGLGAGVGGRTGLGAQSSANQSGIVIPIQAQMNYTASMRFPTPPVAPGRIVTEIRSVIDNTPMLANSKTVQILTDADNNVTLRGNVKDDDEARLIEGLVRITPGVGAIKNELAFPVASK